MTSSPDSLRFRYSGFLQNVDVTIQGQQEASGYKVTCTAQLKLPILKKNFITWTLFKDGDLEWLEHSPVCEEGGDARKVSRATFSADAIDPIGFFLKIDRKEWTADKVNLVIGAREVPLAVLREASAVTIARPEKNQKLVIRTGARGIEALEVPVPVIGNLKINRV